MYMSLTYTFQGGIQETWRILADCLFRKRKQGSHTGADNINKLYFGGLIHAEECVQLLKAGLRSRKLNVRDAAKFSSAVSNLNQGEVDATQGRA